MGVRVVMRLWCLCREMAHSQHLVLNSWLAVASLNLFPDPWDSALQLWAIRQLYCYLEIQPFNNSHNVSPELPGLRAAITVRTIIKILVELPVHRPRSPSARRRQVSNFQSALWGLNA